MSDKPKFPRAVAMEVAAMICRRLQPHCERLIVAGSLRRRKDHVGDVEFVYVSKTYHAPDGLFDTILTSEVDDVLAALIKENIMGKRHTVLGSETWGPKNKLAFHFASGVPLDFFAATEANWFNYLVCRTGGERTNTEIAAAAQRKRWKWNPYGPGFTNERGEVVPVTCEADVFAFAGLPYREPWERL